MRVWLRIIVPLLASWDNLRSKAIVATVTWHLSLKMIAPHSFLFRCLRSVSFYSKTPQIGHSVLYHFSLWSCLGPFIINSVLTIVPRALFRFAILNYASSKFRRTVKRIRNDLSVANAEIALAQHSSPAKCGSFTLSRCDTGTGTRCKVSPRELPQNEQQAAQILRRPNYP